MALIFLGAVHDFPSVIFINENHCAEPSVASGDLEGASPVLVERTKRSLSLVIEFALRQRLGSLRHPPQEHRTN